MVVFSSLISYFILCGGIVNWTIFSLLTIGGLSITFAANALNQALERDYDKLMERTALRPVADGRMNLSMAVLISGIFCCIGVISLAMINPSSAVFGMLSFIIYAFVYTPLKRYSTLAIPVGAIPGALPVLIAGFAAQGTVTIESFSLFGIQYLWQFPHFWAIAWLAHNDYTRAGFKLIKHNDGRPDPSYGLYSMCYAVLGIIFILPFMYKGDMSVIIFSFLVISMLIYAWFGWKLYKENDRNSAKRLMFCSIIYLPVVLCLLLINNWIP